MAQKLFSEAKLGALTLANHIVMAPMTRSRALGNIPNDMIAEYYAQRASAGLIITEGTSPSPNGLGYARIPGIYNAEQIDGWKKVTSAIHGKGSKIFIQLMHTGRISHSANMPNGAEILAPSSVAAAGDMWTDSEGMQPNATPREMTQADVKAAIQEYIQAAKNAIAAGFDGIELHGANGYLIEQFLSARSNQRTDEYGGSIENRARFLLDIAAGSIAAIGADKVGLRLSPFGAAGDLLPHADDNHDLYVYLAEELNKLGLVYLHLVDHSGMGAPAVPAATVAAIRDGFKGTIILCGSYNAERAEEDLESGKADLIAFGRPFIANPDLVDRLETGAELAQLDPATLYAPGPNGFEQGYIDYPTLVEAQQV
ncbi:alkene reductase [Spirosoma sp. KCTC 42546]|uniref:alkene reductase n=1 Tax=Spirosoma sp. KCTC 42546 TaxID=2520506 RepID=UPI00115A7185|nr:alkene reductase [Spirosoma sp. KCTC 42546]QDK77513.1 alkene reductase [Spirosoma sp. KCTC 42546]